MFGDFVDKLRSTPDGDGTLLDHSLVLYGSGMGNADKHDHTNLPVLVAGGPRTPGGRHIRYAQAQPLANLHLTLLDRVGETVRVRGEALQSGDTLYLKAEPGEFLRVE